MQFIRGKIVAFLLVVFFVLALLQIFKDEISNMFYLIANIFFLGLLISFALTYIILVLGGKLKNRFPRFQNFVRRYWFWIILILTAVFYAGIVLLQHWQFRTSFDLGIHDQILWSLSRFQPPFSTFFGSDYLAAHNFWGEHLHPILYLIVPFYWLWSNPRLLIVIQTLIFVLGALPIYWLVKEKFKSEFISFCLVCSYLFFIGAQFAINHVFHPSAFAITFLLFAFYFAVKKKFLPYFIFIFLALACQENISLYVVFLGIYLLFFKKIKKIGLITILLGTIWYTASVHFIMPAYTGGANPQWLRYEHLGANGFEIIKFIILHPIATAKILITPVVKLNTILAFCSAFGFLFIGAPATLLLAIPILAENLLSSQATMWIFYYQYWINIGLALILGVIYALEKIKDKKLLIFFASFCLISAILVDFTFNPWCEMIFQKNFYQLSQADKNVYTILKLIPLENSVSAQQPFYSHLAQRKKVLLFPNIEDAEYIVLSSSHPGGAISPLEWEEKIHQLIQSGDYIIYAQQGNAFLLKRNK